MTPPLTLRDRLREKFAPFYMGAGCLTPHEIADMCIETLRAEPVSDEAAEVAVRRYEIDGGPIGNRERNRMRAAIEAALAVMAKEEP